MNSSSPPARSARRWPGFFVAALLAAVSTPLAALPGDRDQPIRLEADSASFDQRSGVSEYQGNVTLRQGSLQLRAARARLYFADGKFTRMEANGSPSRFSYQPDADKPPIDGVGREVVYHAGERRVVVSGDARFTQGGDEFRGEVIEYDLAADVIRARGGSADRPGRIRITLQPEEER